MKINKFKKLNNNLYEIYIDEDKYKLYDEIILKYNLLAKKEITAKELEIILDENTNYSCYYTALKYLNTKLRTKKEIKNYLLKKEYKENLIDKVILKLENNNIINNKLYITSYIHDQKYLSQNGPDKILNNLLNLGFKEEEILLYLDYEESIWIDKIKKIINKKIVSNKKLSSNELKRKISNDLYNLGYKIETYQELINNIQVDDSESFTKAADKYYEKLKKKYKEPKLSYNFRGKMYSLGYDSELVNQYLESK